MLPRLHKFFQKNKEGIFSNSLDKTSNLYSKTGQDQCKKNYQCHQTKILNKISANQTIQKRIYIITTFSLNKGRKQGEQLSWWRILEYRIYSDNTRILLGKSGWWVTPGAKLIDFLMLNQCNYSQNEKKFILSQTHKNVGEYSTCTHD